MAAYDLEEQEKLDDLKAWWKQWGNTVSGVVIAVCLGVVAVQGWRWWSQRQAEQAAVIYDAVVAAAKAGDAAKAKDAMAQLSSKFGSTAYVPRGALILAAQLYDAGDKAGAKAQLASVIDNAREDELRDIARMRLAAILLDEKLYDEALRTLDAKHDDAFAAVYTDLRGDVLAAAGRRDDARGAYQDALAKLDERSPYRTFVQAKLDALGGPPASAAGAGAAKAATPETQPVKAEAAKADAPKAEAPKAEASQGKAETPAAKPETGPATGEPPAAKGAPAAGTAGAAAPPKR